ncbi:MAG: sulfotransferase family protein [bacterium]
MNPPIIVLGMHRSGTSLVAEIIHRWDAYAGPTQMLMPADDWNASGYWEYLPLVNFNDNLLASIKATWFVPPVGDELLREKARESNFKHKAVKLFSTMKNGGEIWFWKDPRVSILLPFWQKIWDQVIYVVCLRAPVDIAISLKKRNGFPISASLLIWQIYMLSILKNTADEQGIIFIDYDEILQQPVQQCQRLCTFLDNWVGCSKNTYHKTEYMAQAVNMKLSHNKSSVRFDEFVLSTPDQRELHQFLEQKLKDPFKKFDSTQFSVYPGWREYLLTLAESMRMRLKLRRFIQEKKYT